MITTTFYMCRSTICGKIFFLPENSYFLCSFFGIWVTNLWFFEEKFLVGLPKLQFPLLENHFWWKQILIKNCNSILFGLWETLSYFWRQSYGSLVKISLYMFRRTFWGKKGFLENLIFFHHFRSSSKKFPEFWEEFSGRVVTTAFYMYLGKFLGKLFSSRKVQSFFRGFRNLSCKCVDSQRKIFATVVRIAFSVAKESFLMKKITLFKKL